jgi:adenylate kinase
MNKSDCANRGWILDGYPTNARQLHCLQIAGILPNKVVVLTGDKAMCQESALKQYEGMTTEEFNEAYGEYARNIKQIEPLFPADSKRFIDASQSGAAVWDQISSFCGLSAPCKAPRRPMRLSLLGQTGSGKETQAKKLAHTYGLVHVSVGNLLRKEMAKSYDLRQQLEAFTKEGQLVPDYIICPIVIDRLLQSDCRSRGWCLDGFPRTRQQASSLTKANLSPNRVVFLEVGQDVSEGRCLSRRIDPETGLVYDMRVDGSAPQQVAKRLVTQEKDTAKILKNLLASYNKTAEELKENYGSVSQTIDGSQAEDAVFTNIQTFYLAALGAARFGEE